jgi:integrase
MPRPRRKCYSRSFGGYGSKVRVAELVPYGTLYLLWVEPSKGQRKRSLGHTDRKQGQAEALALANQLAQHRDAPDSSRLTLSKLFENCLKNGMHGRTLRHRRELERKLQRWTDFLGAARVVETLSPSDVDRFVAARSGVSNTTIWHDYVALVTALNFATRHRNERGKPLLTANPLRGVKVSKTVNPKQPVATESYYTGLLAAASSVNNKLTSMIHLAFSTGHRIDAILKLRWSDIVFAEATHSPFGSIRWRAEHDKIGNDHVVPMNEIAHSTLAELARVRPAIGEAWIFSSEKNDAQPIDRHLANRWLRRAEKIAGIDHEVGRGWHSFRRAWASARKHLPDVDVAAAGGWKDTTTMKRCYQHADPASVFDVVTLKNQRNSA